MYFRQFRIDLDMDLVQILASYRIFSCIFRVFAIRTTRVFERDMYFGKQCTELL